MGQCVELGPILLIQYGNASLFSFLNLISLNLINSWNPSAPGDLQFPGRIWRVPTCVKLDPAVLKFAKGEVVTFSSPTLYRTSAQHSMDWEIFRGLMPSPPLSRTTKRPASTRIGRLHTSSVARSCGLATVADNNPCHRITGAGRSAASGIVHSERGRPRMNANKNCVEFYGV